MTFSDAVLAFADNVSRLDPATDPVMWNLSKGLLALAEAMNVQQYQLEQKLQQLERQIQNLG